ncbi:MAG: hypothetical protein SFY92_00695 [Verrucomicrobiae bacterium]|nr:hypothetical protein [Verrucomicrobiae bacterium]
MNKADSSLIDETPIVKPAPEPSPGHPAIMAIVNASWAARFWFVMFLAACFAGFIFVQFTVWTMRTKEKAFFFSKDGTVIYTPLDDFLKEKYHFDYMCRQVMRARFEMNPSGLSNPELLRRLFVKTTRDEARSESEKFLGEVRSKDIRNFSQFVNVLQISVPKKVAQDGQEFYSVRVKAQFFRTGTIQGLPLDERPIEEYDIIFMKNDDVANNGFFPLVVAQFGRVK